jgi:predicted AAA+ superfamily ATPase
MEPMYPRLLSPPTRSFFLFGPRGVGKSTWVKQSFPQAKTLSLLDRRLYLTLARAPHRLEELIGTSTRGSWIILDGVQKLPELLDEVDRLIEERGLKFALTGSSVRKLKRGAANLLGGRALTLSMSGLSFRELGADFSLHEILEWGSLPLVIQDKEQRRDILESYVSTYLKEEIQEEGVIRKLQPFIRFLEVAGLMNGEILNLENIARDAAVPRSSLDSYFQILEDTLLAHRLYPYHAGIRVREVKHPKLYWFDTGVARGAAGLLFDAVDGTWLGKSFETWLLHELQIHNQVARRKRSIHYFRTGAGVEIDFVVETRKKSMSTPAEVILIEAKHSKKWDPRWSKGANEFAADKKIKVKASYGVYLGPDELTIGTMHVLPVQTFMERLHAGAIF